MIKGGTVTDRQPVIQFRDFSYFYFSFSYVALIMSKCNVIKDIVNRQDLPPINRFCNRFVVIKIVLIVC